MAISNEEIDYSEVVAIEITWEIDDLEDEGPPRFLALPKWLVARGNRDVCEFLSENFGYLVQFWQVLPEDRESSWK